MFDQLFTPENLKLLAVAAAGLFGAKYLFKTDTKVEKRRRGAAELAGRYREMGLITISDLLLDYSVGDYSGMSKKVYSVYDHAKENGLDAEFETVFQKMLAAKLQDPEERAAIKERLTS